MQNPKDRREALQAWLEFYKDTVGVDGFMAKTKSAEKSSVSEKTKLLDEAAREVAACKKCRLHETRIQTVFGVGNPDANLMFVGEGPGKDEDEQGEPFVGRSGKLLTKIIEAMGESRKTIYIANIVKCRPPENRDPKPDESDTCFPYLMKQIDIIDPRIIVTLGSPSTQLLLGEKTPISKVRGQFRDWYGRYLLPTFHPAYLLRYAAKKKEVWEDMQLVRDTLKDMKKRGEI